MACKGVIRLSEDIFIARNCHHVNFKDSMHILEGSSTEIHYDIFKFRLDPQVKFPKDQIRFSLDSNSGSLTAICVYSKIVRTGRTQKVKLVVK